MSPFTATPTKKREGKPSDVGKPDVGKPIGDFGAAASRTGGTKAISGLADRPRARLPEEENVSYIKI